MTKICHKQEILTCSHQEGMMPNLRSQINEKIRKTNDRNNSFSTKRKEKNSYSKKKEENMKQKLYLKGQIFNIAIFPRKSKRDYSIYISLKKVIESEHFECLIEVNFIYDNLWKFYSYS